MTIEHAEIPPEQQPQGRPESLPPPTRVNRRLWMAVILILGVVLVIGIIGWLVLAGKDKTMPEGLAVILGTVAGALVSLVSDMAKN